MGKNLLRLDTSGFEEYIAKLEKLEADVKPIVTEALNKAGVKITSDTTNAVVEPNYRAVVSIPPAKRKPVSSKTHRPRGLVLSQKSAWVLTLINPARAAFLSRVHRGWPRIRY